MANNVLGTKITDLEEAQAEGLTDDALLIVEPETLPTKRSKLSTFFTWVKGKLAAWILSSYDEVMAATEAGYLVDALAVKVGFTQLNTNIVSNQKIYFDDDITANTSPTSIKIGMTLTATNQGTSFPLAYGCIITFKISERRVVQMNTGPYGEFRIRTGSAGSWEEWKTYG